MAAGIRRIEAITGRDCENMVYQLEDMLKSIRQLFNNAKDLRGVIQKHIEENASMKKEIEAFQAQVVERAKDVLIGKAQTVNGVKVVKAVLNMDAQAAKDLVFKVKQAINGSMLCVIGSSAGNRPTLTVALSEDLVNDHGLNAGQMVREAAKLIQGGGGGQPHFATAGGKLVDELPAAVDRVIEIANL